jgi:UDP:flavonoid glycosyltransferase YjiC (YdhE family)
MPDRAGTKTPEDIMSTKKKILFTCQPIESHVRPLAPVATACMRQGSEVVVAAASTFGDRISGTYRLPYVQAGRDWTTDPGVTQIFARLLSDGNDEFNRQLFTRFLAGPPTLEMARDIFEFAKYWRPDVIVHDCSEFGGYLAAVLLDIPHISLDNGLVRLVRDLHDAYAPALNEHRRALDLDDEPDTPGSHRYGVATPAPGDFLLHDFGDVLSCFQHVNPSRAGEHLPPWMTRIPDDRPLIYVSLGSLGPCAPALAESVLRTYDVILDVLSTYSCTAVVAVGRDNVQRFGNLPKHIHIMANAPQPLVLRVADLYIGHGGFGGLREAIDAAVPLLILPFFADQPANAARCTELGLGVTHDPLTVTTADVHASVSEMLRSPSYKKQMRALQRRALALPPLSVSKLMPDAVQVQRYAA